MKKLTRQDLLDILYGATILGTGGGGSLECGIEKVDEALALGKEFILADFSELADHELIATPYSCGAISPLTEEEIKKYEGLPLAEEEPHVIALREMERYLNQEVKAVISTELGGGNTATALYTAAMAGKLIVDGDPAGRSVPGLQHSTYFLNDVSIDPMTLVNQFGESLVVSKVTDDYRAEAIVRALAMVSQNSIAVVDHVKTAGELRNAVIKGATTQAWEIGKAFREAKQAGADVPEAIVKVGRGTVLFRGTIGVNDWKTENGFTLGTMTVLNEAGDELRIWYQNENIITWKNGRYEATVPDLVCVYNEDAQEPLLNPYGEKGMNVTVYVLPAPKEWTTKRGLEVFGPKSFGHAVEWKPYV